MMTYQHSLSLFLLLLGSMAGCFGCRKQPQKQTEQDTRPLTINILGAPYEYYQKLQKKAKESYNIDIIIENACAINGTGNMRNRITHDDAPDIITTGLLLLPEQQKNNLLDLAQFSFVDSFKRQQLMALNLDGGIYQIPLSSKLIGIQYNKTLFKEQGWSLPQSFNDLQKLIPKVRAAGYEISTTILSYVNLGYSFNYLFHFAGSTYLSTPAGCNWFENFISGKTDSMAELQSTVAYLEKLKGCGFFGLMTQSDDISTFRAQRRSAFCVDIIFRNGSRNYRGWHVNQSGNVIDGKYEEDKSGPFIRSNQTYVAYDSTNAAHQNQKRYKLVDGKKLDDEYGIMPWFNENGDNNCFCVYHNFLVGLNRHLNAPNQSKRLKQALTVLEIMSSPEFTNYFVTQSCDVYSLTKGFKLDESRVYYECAETVNNNYIMPWYYSSFDEEVICDVGRVMNDWLFDKNKRDGSPVTGEDVLKELHDAQTAFLQKGNSYKALGKVPQDLSIQESSELLALAIGMGVQKQLRTMAHMFPQPQDVKLAIVPYAGLTDKRDGIACTSRLYHGNAAYSSLHCLLPVHCTLADAVMLTGAEIKALLMTNDVPNASPRYTALFHGDDSLDDNTAYLAAVFSTNKLPSPLLNVIRTNKQHYVSCKIQVLQALQDCASVLGEITPKTIRDYARSGDWNAGSKVEK